MANVGRLRELKVKLREAADAGEWDQHNWAIHTACGTTLCAAGWTCIMAGKRLHFDWAGRATLTTDGARIPKFAAIYLELSPAEMEALFLTFTDDIDEMEAKIDAVIAKYV